MRIDNLVDATPTGEIDASGNKSMLNIPPDEDKSQLEIDNGENAEEEAEEEDEEGSGKFAKIQVDESDNTVMNMTKLIHHGSMDDVYIL